MHPALFILAVVLKSPAMVVCHFPSTRGNKILSSQCNSQVEVSLTNRSPGKSPQRMKGRRDYISVETFRVRVEQLLSDFFCRHCMAYELENCLKPSFVKIGAVVLEPGGFTTPKYPSTSS